MSAFSTRQQQVFGLCCFLYGIWLCAVIITEEGKPFGEENTITAAVKRVLGKTPKAKRIAAINLSTSRSVDDVVESLGGKIYKSPVGEINVIKKMQKVKAVIGGEGSGGQQGSTDGKCEQGLAHEEVSV